MCIKNNFTNGKFYNVSSVLVSLVTFSFQLSDNDSQDLPPFPDPRDDTKSASTSGSAAPAGDSGPILPVPVGVRPTLATYR